MTLVFCVLQTHGLAEYIAQVRNSSNNMLSKQEAITFSKKKSKRQSRVISNDAIFISQEIQLKLFLHLQHFTDCRKKWIARMDTGGL